jgi:hypothetical protein
VQFDDGPILAVASNRSWILLIFLQVSTLSLLHMLLHLMMLQRVKIQMKQKMKIKVVIHRESQKMMRLCPQMRMRAGKSLRGCLSRRGSPKQGKFTK